MSIHFYSICVGSFVTVVFWLLSGMELIDGNKKTSENYACVAFISVILTVFLTTFMCIGTIKMGKQPWICDKEPYAVEHIVGLADNNLTNGRFYMRRGYIEDKLYYQYMVELGNGGFVANKVNSADATLFYDTSNYRVEWYKKTKSWLYFRGEKICHKIYIPEGSITDDYMIDLN